MSNLADHFIRDTRDNSESFYKLKDDAPEWLADAIQEAHNGTLPNDWIYNECHSAVCEYDSGNLNEDSLHEHVDGQVDVYTKNRFMWAAEFCLTNTYSDAEERAEGLGGGSTDVNEILGTIQYCAIEFIAQTMLAACLEHATPLDDDGSGLSTGDRIN